MWVAQRAWRFARFRLICVCIWNLDLSDGARSARGEGDRWMEGGVGGTSRDGAPKMLLSNLSELWSAVGGRWLSGGWLSVCFGQFPYNLPFVRFVVIVPAVVVAAVAVVFSFCYPKRKITSMKTLIESVRLQITLSSEFIMWFIWNFKSRYEFRKNSCLYL